MRNTLALAAAAAVALAASASQAAPGEKWQVSSTMNMAGHVMALPPQTVCQPPGGQIKPPMGGPVAGRCTVQNFQKVGSTVSWKLACAGGDGGEGHMTYSNVGTYTGAMTVHTRGQTMSMTMQGKRIGVCDMAAKVGGYHAPMAHH